MSDRPFAGLGGEELRRRAKAADRALGAELDRLSLADERFRAALNLALALESEIENRRNT